MNAVERSSTPEPQPVRTREVLITGAASGIGLGLAEAFARHGSPVIAVDCNRKALAELAAVAERRNWSVDTHAVDVTNEPDTTAFIEAVSPRNVGILINNAGLQHVAPIEDFPAQRWHELVDVMLVGAYRMTSGVIPGMKERNYGRVINIGSIHSLVASPYKSAYVAAKHGLLGFSKSIALETASYDITVNTICPSYVRTALVDRQIAMLAREHDMSEADVVEEIMLKPMPKRSFISIDELTGIVEFLLSDAARNITGQAIAVDGGWTAQ